MRTGALDDRGVRDAEPGYLPIKHPRQEGLAELVEHRRIGEPFVEPVRVVGEASVVPVANVDPYLQPQVPPSLEQVSGEFEGHVGRALIVEGGDGVIGAESQGLEVKRRHGLTIRRGGWAVAWSGPDTDAARAGAGELNLDPVAARLEVARHEGRLIVPRTLDESACSGDLLAVSVGTEIDRRALGHVCG